MRHRVAPLLGAVALLLAGMSSAESLTPKHELGRCAFRGHCGKQSLFGKELPCVDNDLADDPDAELRKELVDLCGSEWAEGPVCCTMEQVGLEGTLLRSSGTDSFPGPSTKREPRHPEHPDRLMPGLQVQLLQYVLHVHLFSRPVDVCQRDGCCR